MGKIICPITKKEFDCLKCSVIVEGEKCPYMLRDEQTEREMQFLRKIIEREMSEKANEKTRNKV